MKPIKFIKSSKFGLTTLVWDELAIGARSTTESAPRMGNTYVPMTKMEFETFEDMVARGVNRTCTCSSNYLVVTEPPEMTEENKERENLKYI